MTIGFVCPVVLLPAMDFSADELSFILKHELVHCKRKDLWCKGLVLIATAMHWFNPVVYLMAIAVQCEVSCDVAVVQNASVDVRQRYSETIIGVIENQSRIQTALSTSFYGGKGSMKTRHTTDGGRTWSQSEIPQAGGNGVMYWGTITFSEDRYGWLMAVNGQHDSPAELFATTDSGAIWSQIASMDDGHLPCGGEISFRDPATGWMVGNLGGNGDSYPNILYRTQDGGCTWLEQDLKLPPGYPKSTIGIGGINDDSPVFSRTVMAC
jgi:photosystem II stability/assembly factor-like uncharacterized protein